MRFIYTSLCLLAFGALVALAACQKTKSANAEYAPGAFPPVLSNAEYHQRAWTRTDCLTCHESGVQKAPKMKHASVTKLAKGSKCRSCHVTASAQEP